MQIQKLTKIVNNSITLVTYYSNQIVSGYYVALQLSNLSNLLRSLASQDTTPTGAIGDLGTLYTPNLLIIPCCCTAQRFVIIEIMRSTFRIAVQHRLPNRIRDLGTTINVL